MSERFKTFWLGLFIIGGIAITGWLILFLKPPLGDEKVTLNVRFTNIDRITDGTRVTFAGRPVGQVSEIRPIADLREAPADSAGNLYTYELTLKVDSSVQVFTYDEITYASSGLLGEKSITIIPKEPPPGAPEPRNITDEMLYATSSGNIEQTLNQLTKVAESVEDAMENVSGFLEHNQDDFNVALHSISSAADQLTDFLGQANATHVITKLNDTLVKADHLFSQMIDQHVVERFSKSVDNLYNVTNKLANGEGTLGRLLNSDSLYLKLTALMCKFDTLLNDVNNYGLLFQYNKHWQRTRSARIAQMQQLCSPCDFYSYFDNEMNQISISLNRVADLMNTLECRELQMDNAYFSESYLELLQRVQCLNKSLRGYTEMMIDEYCKNYPCR